MVRQLVDDNRALLADPGRPACAAVRDCPDYDGAQLPDAVAKPAVAAAHGPGSDARLYQWWCGWRRRERRTAQQAAVAAALEEAQARSREVMVAVFGIVMAELGLRLRDPSWTAEHLQLAGGLFVQGLALRNVQVRAALGGGGDPATPRAADPADGTSTAAHVDALPSTRAADTWPVAGLHGGTAEWTVGAFAYLGLIDAFAELDPDFVPQ